jgi:hypothetical protein
MCNASGGEIRSAGGTLTSLSICLPSGIAVRLGGTLTAVSVCLSVCNPALQPDWVAPDLDLFLDLYDFAWPPDNNHKCGPQGPVLAMGKIPAEHTNVIMVSTHTPFFRARASQEDRVSVCLSVCLVQFPNRLSACPSFWCRFPTGRPSVRLRGAGAQPSVCVVQVLSCLSVCMAQVPDWSFEDWREVGTPGWREMQGILRSAVQRFPWDSKACRGLRDLASPSCCSPSVCLARHCLWDLQLSICLLGTPLSIYLPACLPGARLPLGPCGCPFGVEPPWSCGHLSRRERP